MGDAPAKWRPLGVFLIHVQRVKIAGNAGKPHNIRFGNRSPARAVAFAKRILFKRTVKSHAFPSPWLVQKRVKTNSTPFHGCHCIFC